ncbi:MAG: SMP-30/gluconolactonase/LRE family protein [Deltaproteobacteria bacterium]|nr:SMP-30/gluconolactonase/LRE family protein [Deltaproteobacteria bacterium]
MLILIGAPVTGFTASPPALAISDQQPSPIPENEKNLPTIVAEPYFKVSDKGLQLEAPIFDRAGNLLFVEVFGGRIFKLTPDKKLTTVLEANKLGSAGLALHKDGRIFIAGLGDFKKGSLVAIKSDGSGMQTIIPESKGYLVDDLVFDNQGGIYFTDFRGISTDPKGGVYYVSPDFKTITPVLPNLAIANGIALSPDGKVLWTTEMGTNRLHRVDMSDATTIAPFGTGVPYHFSGNHGPDSMRCDTDGNVYVAMYPQGRVMVFNKLGLPIGQILIPGRQKGHNMRTTSIAIKPGSDEMFIVTNDWEGGEGSSIFTCKALAKGLTYFGLQ